MDDLSQYTIKEIKDKCEKRKIDENFIKKLAADSRKGVKKLAEKFKREKKKKEKLKQKWVIMNKTSAKLRDNGHEMICGLDEAGRGPLAGPVVASAVLLDPFQKIIGLDDSKKLSAVKRNELFEEIKEKAMAVGIGIVKNDIIDKINIQQASFKAMKKALN